MSTFWQQVYLLIQIIIERQHVVTLQNFSYEVL